MSLGGSRKQNGGLAVFRGPTIPCGRWRHFIGLLRQIDGAGKGHKASYTHNVRSEINPVGTSSVGALVYESDLALGFRWGFSCLHEAGEVVGISAGSRLPKRIQAQHPNGQTHE